MTGVLCTVWGARVYLNVCPICYTAVWGNRNVRLVSQTKIAHVSPTDRQKSVHSYCNTIFLWRAYVFRIFFSECMEACVKATGSSSPDFRHLYAESSTSISLPWCLNTSLTPCSTDIPYQTDQAWFLSQITSSVIWYFRWPNCFKTALILFIDTTTDMYNNNTCNMYFHKYTPCMS